MVRTTPHIPQPYLRPIRLPYEPPMLLWFLLIQSWTVSRTRELELPKHLSNTSAYRFHNFPGVHSPSIMVLNSHLVRKSVGENPMRNSVKIDKPCRILFCYSAGPLKCDSVQREIHERPLSSALASGAALHYHISGSSLTSFGFSSSLRMTLLCVLLIYSTRIIIVFAGASCICCHPAD